MSENKDPQTIPDASSPAGPGGDGNLNAVSQQQTSSMKTRSMSEIEKKSADLKEIQSEQSPHITGNNSDPVPKSDQNPLELSDPYSSQKMDSESQCVGDESGLNSLNTLKNTSPIKSDDASSHESNNSNQSHKTDSNGRKRKTDSEESDLSQAKQCATEPVSSNTATNSSKNSNEVEAMDYDSQETNDTLLKNSPFSALSQSSDSNTPSTKSKSGESKQTPTTNKKSKETRVDDKPDCDPKTNKHKTMGLQSTQNVQPSANNEERGDSKRTPTIDIDDKKSKQTRVDDKPDGDPMTFKPKTYVLQSTQNVQPSTNTDTHVAVRFHILVKQSDLRENKVCIVFGRLFGDWDVPFELNAFNKQTIDFGSISYFYFSNTIDFDKKYCGERIPYKYILLKSQTMVSSWEEFSEDPIGGKLNRVLVLPDKAIDLFDKYDDVLSTNRHNQLDHSAGRCNAFAIMAEKLFSENDFEKSVAKIIILYEAQISQKLVNEKMELQSFGSRFIPKFMIYRCVKYLSTFYQNKCPIIYCKVSLLTCLMFGEFKAPEDRREHYNSIFEGFREFLDRYNDDESVFQKHFTFSHDFLPRVVRSVVDVINDYLIIMEDRLSMRGDIIWIYAYRFVRRVQCDLDYDCQIKFDLWEKICIRKSYDIDFSPILKIIRNSPAENDSFKHEYLKLASVSCFRELILSQDIALFHPLEITKKIFHIFESTILTDSFLNTALPKLLNYYRFSMDSIKPNDLITMISIIGALANKCKKTSVCKFSLDVLQGISGIKDLDDDTVISECKKQVETICDILSEECVKLKIPSMAARDWTVLFNRLESLNNPDCIEVMRRKFDHQIQDWDKRKCLDVLGNEFQNLSPHVNEFLINVIFEQGSFALHTNSTVWDKFLEKVSWKETPEKYLKNLGQLISKLILDLPAISSKNDDYCGVVRAVTERAYFCQIVRHYDAFKKFIPDDAQARMQHILLNVDLFLDHLRNGNLLLSSIRVLTDERRQFIFLELFRIKSKDYRILVKKRIEELNCVAENKQCAKLFIKYFQENTKSDLFEPEGFISFTEENTLLNKVCQVRQETNNESWNLPPKLSFQFSNEELLLMRNFMDFRRSKCFSKMVTQSLRHKATEEWGYPDVLNIAGELVGGFKSFCERLTAGSIPLREIKIYFGQVKDVLQIHQELGAIDRLGVSKNDWLTNIESKIKLYLKMNELKEIASTLSETVGNLNIGGQLDTLDRIVKLSSETDQMFDKPLNYLTQEIMQFGGLFSKWNRFVLPALQTFNSCTALVKWIRENIKSTQEFKVFIDLANISAGESDIEVDRVICFQSSVTAYYSLLFDCKNKITLDQLLDAVNSLNSSLERDPKIPDKFLSSSRHIGWIKLVKERHGSVETSSLNMVKQINRTGHFNLISKEDSHDENFVEVTLTYVETIDQENYEKCLPLKALIELESKLMLISVNSEMQSEVDRFLKILHNVDLIQKELCTLIVQGCCLFSEFSITVFMAKKEVSLSVDFGHRTGILRGTGKVDEELSMLITFLEIAKGQWKEYMTQLRASVPELNVFTSDQLVCLSKFLADLESKTSVQHSHEAMMLMNSISQEISLQHIKEALENVTGEEEKVCDESMSTSSQEDEDEDSANNDEVVRLRQDIHEQYGFDLDHFNLAINKVGSLDEEQIAQWCIQNSKEDVMNDIDMSADESESEDLESLPQQQSQEQEIRDFINKVAEDYGLPDTFVFAAILSTGNIEDDTVVAGWCFDNIEQHEEIDLQKLVDSGIVAHLDTSAPCPVIKSAVHIPMDLDTSDRQVLQCKLIDVWEKFIKSNNVTKAEDFVSFQKLGMVVDKLSRKFSRVVDRKFLPCLTEGQPNLIIVKNNVIYESALMIYQFDESKPLPSIDEILICNSNTTEEKLILHCSKAFNDKSGKIFTVMHADKISFHNGNALEKLLKTPAENHRYRLVFLSSKENDDSSYISTLLQKHKVSDFPDVRRQYDDLRSYVYCHLQNSNPVDPTMSRFRIISSSRSGDGKSLVAGRLSSNKNVPKYTFSIHSDKIDKSRIISACFKKLTTSTYTGNDRYIYHFDISPVVHEGERDFLFSIAILKGINDYKGRLWLCSPNDVYIAEITKEMAKNDFFSLFPTVCCKSPKESLFFYQENPHSTIDHFHEEGLVLNHYMDYLTFLSDELQRPYQFLDEFVRCMSLDDFYFESGNPNGSVIDFLTIFLEHCGIPEPSWKELSNFWKFLNVQLMSCENSHFCNAALIGEELPTFKRFVVKFLIKMSKDFSTRSAEISDKSFPIPEIPDRNRWEQVSHPYLFFNEEGHTISFFGISIMNGNLIDERSGLIIENNIMSPELQKGLVDQGVTLRNQLSTQPQESQRYFFIEQLCMVFGVKDVYQFDNEYELTADNVLKMLAIHMRFRADIPVIIMGETGTGKTRLVRFMCDLQKQGCIDRQNMIILKCHGGTQEANVYAKVRQAIELAEENMRHGIRQTVLFFDEANTTHAIGSIKEVMCDNLVEGEPIPTDIGLKFVAAVNPYREHSTVMIKKLEEAGLGYHMKAENTQDRLGRIPMRRLVYRVKELPLSLVPFIWDFGRLDSVAESKYIYQMIENSFKTTGWTMQNKCLLMELLTVCQGFMRRRKDECSFVSLRDVERCLRIICWFHDMEIILEVIKSRIVELESEEQVDDFTLVSILAIGCAYYVRLDERETFRQEISLAYEKCGISEVSEDYFQYIIELCQDIFVDELKLQPTISKNEALKENVWIMAICIELRIPLFLVGKPGSSKSLAKTVVSDVMQGEASYSKLFKNFKEIQLVSFQCSPLATADGILTTFRQCQKYQEKQDLTKFVSCVVLDEVGLAEDSPKMPLKALHPLLEDGCVDEESPKSFKKVGFVGISNWALDPAKMNRGIYLSRGQLSKEDLKKTALGICDDDDDGVMIADLEPMIDDIVDAYLKIYKEQEREYYGLRDFYSLIKMLYANFKRDQEITTHSLKLSISRCFGGEFGSVKASEVFMSKMKCLMTDPTEIDPRVVIKSALGGQADSRYLLFLTKNNSALSVLQNNSALMNQRVTIIYGSSFSRDQQYIQLCKNINKIKLSMEVGQTVILCNLTSLYESLYDALNQSYVEMGGSRYVDLGLGIHRVKCRVHELFRLIVVAEDKEVLDKFPIPLLNRLEKHYLGINSLLVDSDYDIVEKLKSWICRFAEVESQLDDDDKSRTYTAHDVFIGYHTDVPANLVFHAKESMDMVDEEDILKQTKSILMRCTVPDALVRLSSSDLSSLEKDEAFEEYSRHQQHSSLANFILNHDEGQQSLFQITTYSRLLTHSSLEQLATDLHLNKSVLELIFLQQIDTEDHFKQMLKKFLDNCCQKQYCGILVIQCHIQFRSQSLNLIECARYIIEELIKEFDCSFSIVLLIRIHRTIGGTFVGFPSSSWIGAHLDELFATPKQFDINELKDKSLSDIISNMSLDNIKTMILQALPSACASNEIMAKHRVINRIAIIRDSLNTDFSNRFLDLIRRLIIQFQVNGEKLIESKNWLFKAATSSVYLHEGHTFQESLWMTITDHIERHLTRLLSFLDAYNGLNHLNAESTTSDWKYAFYMKFLENANFLSDDFTLPINSANFNGEFPFFWFYFEFFEKLSSPDQDCNTFLTIIHSTELGKLLCDTFMRHNVDACESFAADIVVLTWPIADKYPHLRSLLVNQLLAYANSKLIPSRLEANREMFEDFVQPTDLYLALKQLKDKLNITVKAVELCDYNVQDLTNFKHQSDEHNIDDRAIDVLLSVLEPKNLDIADKRVLTIWMDKINQLKFIIQNYNQNQNAERKADLDSQLKRLELLKLFVQHVIRGFECDNPFRLKLRQSLKRFMVVFSKNCDFKLNETFQSFIDQLNQLSEETGKALFCGGIDKCFICLEDLTEPVALPCQHVACFECIKNSIKSRSSKRGKWNCPAEKCNKMYKEDFIPKRTTECDRAVAMHRTFREKVNTFFLEVLQLHVFYGHDPPHKEIVNTLLRFVVAQELPKRKSDKTTKNFGLFSGDCIDSSPVVRSFIFQMLLKGDWSKVDTYLTKIYESKFKFADNSKMFKAELCLLLVYSMEDSLGAKSSKQIALPNQPCVYFSSIKRIVQSISKLRTNSSFMNRLEFVAKIRFCLTNIMPFFNAFVSENKELTSDESNVLGTFCQIVKTDKQDCIKKFIVRELASKYRTDSISSWKQTGQFLDLMPESLRQVDLNYIPDIQIMFGKPYISLRNDLHTTLYSENSDEISITDKNLMFYRLANFYLLAKLDPNNESDQKNIDALINRENAIQTLSAERKQLSSRLITSIQMNINPRDRSIYTISFFLYEVLHQLQITQTRSISSFFVDLCFGTANLVNQFYPTMPHDDDVEARNAVLDITRLYYCPNGHAYGVGDCGQLNGTSTCPTCRAVIGRGQANARDAQLQDTTQSGYVLAAANTQNVTRVRALDNSQVAIVRFLMHSAMFVSQNKAGVTAIVKPQEDIDQYLLNIMRLNLTQLSAALGKNEDQAQVLLHSVITRVLSDRTRSDRSLASKQARAEWETSLSQIVLQPSIAELDRTYQHYQSALTVDQNAGQNIIREILQKKEPFESFNLDHSPFLPHLWIPRHQITLENISTHYALDKMQQECPLFTILLENRFDLQYLHNLIPIIKLQNLLVSKFNRKLDPADLEGKTIRQFLFYHIKNTCERDELKRLIEIYLHTFNRLRDQIFQFDQSAVAASKHYETVHKNHEPASVNTSPCGIIFPDVFGHSLTASVTVQFLIDKHNSMMKRYIESTESTVQTVPPSDIDLCHLVDLQIEELSMLLLNNCRYTLQPGKSTKPDIDLQNLERQIISRYFIGRTLVESKQAPKLQLMKEDTVSGTGSFDINQIPLPQSLHKQIETSVSSSPADVSMIMTHCVTIRKLLSFTNSSSLELTDNDPLTQVMKQLHIVIPEHLQSSRFLDNICLTHLDDFILFLKVLRAKLMLFYKQNPWYGFLDLEMQTGLSSSLKNGLSDILNHMQPHDLLSRLYRFMEAIVRTKRASGDFELGESIYWYLYEFNDDEADKLNNYLPREILVKHCASCFSHLVEQINAN